MIAVVGGFSAHNFGDRLYPAVMGNLLRQLGVDHELGFYALTPLRLPDGTQIQSQVSLAARRPRLVLVGGGDIIRTDRKVVAMDHLDLGPRARRRVTAGIRARRFAARHMPDGPGPWLLNPTRLGAAVGWISVGVRRLDGARPEVSEVSAAWIRNQPSLQHAVDAGLDPSRAALGPDAVFAIGGQIDREAARQRGRTVLARATGGDGKAVCVVHAAPFTGWSAAQLVESFSDLGRDLVFLSMGRYVREDVGLRQAAKTLGRPLLEPSLPDGIIDVLAAAGSVFTTSMHAAIVARSLGRPVVHPGVSKIADAFAGCAEPLSLTTCDPSTAAEAVQGVNGVADLPTSEADVTQVADALGAALSRLGV